MKRPKTIQPPSLAQIETRMDLLEQGGWLLMERLALPIQAEGLEAEFSQAVLCLASSTVRQAEVALMAAFGKASNHGSASVDDEVLKVAQEFSEVGIEGIKVLRREMAPR